MYHLTRYRWFFFALSGLVIVPGLLALIFWHLNLGIDFTNGSTVDLRFARNDVTITQIQSAFKNVGAQDVNVLSSTDLKSGTNAHYVYLQFSRPIGDNVSGTSSKNYQDGVVYQRLAPLDPSTQDSSGNPTGGTQVVYVLQTLSVPGKPDSALVVVLFDKAVTQSAIESALKTLPATTAPSSVIPGTSTSTPTTSATTTPATTATATPKATTTATPSATATPSSSSSAPTFPVSLSSVDLGQNQNLYQVETQTALDGRKAPTPETIALSLFKQFGPVYVVQKTEVGPAIAGETARNAVFAVILASLAIMAYIAIAFHKVGSYRLSFRFGASAIIALLHDAFVVLGLWAIFGHFFDYKVDTLFLTAVLTVIGFSVHDTIVVFDRIRENLARRTSESFGTVVDTSLIQTMSRSLNTSLTVLFTLSAEVLFGGSSIHDFVLALLIGIASGTYSSIFNASMILYVWETGELPRIFRRWRGGGRTRSVAPRPARDLVGSRA